jgi:hypothetical protein
MKMSKTILVYVCDYDHVGRPIYAVADSIEDIPEDNGGALVGEYQLVKEHQIVIKRTLLALK